MNGPSAEFGQWTADETRGLCLSWHDHPPMCAPVYQIGSIAYRWGDVELRQLGQ
jgi:hypothetical protein